MTIEWPTGPTSSDMTVDVPDNWPAPPAGPKDMLVAHLPFDVNIKWTVPFPHNMLLGGSFRLRAYVESLGPGQEMQLGPTKNVPVVPFQIPYNATIPIPGHTLLGEGDLYYEPGAPPPPGVPVSGVYKIVAVLQHLNPGPTWVSGFAEVSLRMFLSP